MIKFSKGAVEAPNVLEIALAASRTAAATAVAMGFFYAAPVTASELVNGIRGAEAYLYAEPGSEDKAGTWTRSAARKILRNHPVRVVGRKADWVQVELPNEKYGPEAGLYWVREKSLKFKNTAVVEDGNSMGSQGLGGVRGLGAKK